MTPDEDPWLRMNVEPTPDEDPWLRMNVEPQAPPQKAQPKAPPQSKPPPAGYEPKAKPKPFPWPSHTPSVPTSAEGSGSSSEPAVAQVETKASGLPAEPAKSGFIPRLVVEGNLNSANATDTGSAPHPTYAGNSVQGVLYAYLQWARDQEGLPPNWEPDEEPLLPLSREDVHVTPPSTSSAEQSIAPESGTGVELPSAASGTQSGTAEPPPVDVNNAHLHEPPRTPEDDESSAGEADYEMQESQHESSVVDVSDSDDVEEFDGEDDWEAVHYNEHGKPIKPPMVRCYSTFSELIRTGYLPYWADAFTFLKAIWPQATATETHIMIKALERVQVDEQVVRIAWEPIPEETNSTGSASSGPAKLSLVHQVPQTWGSTAGADYFHGTCMANLPSIRKVGLIGHTGVSNDYTRAVYTCKTRWTPIKTYSTPFELEFLNFDARAGTTVAQNRTFIVALGLRSKLPWPHHSGKVKRKNLDYHQYFFRQRTFDVSWVEIICTAGDRIDELQYLTDGRSRRRVSARADRADALITRLADADKVLLAAAPPPRVPKSPWALNRGKAFGEEASANSKSSGHDDPPSGTAVGSRPDSTDDDERSSKYRRTEAPQASAAASDTPVRVRTWQYLIRDEASYKWLWLDYGQEHQNSLDATYYSRRSTCTLHNHRGRARWSVNLSSMEQTTLYDNYTTMIRWSSEEPGQPLDCYPGSSWSTHR